MIPIREALDLALQHHRSGDLQSAERIYRTVLQTAPNDPDAWHRLGLLAMQIGRLDDAIECIQKAISYQPRDGAYHNNLAVCYQRKGDNAKALECFQEAVRVSPRWAEGRVNLGITLANQGRLPEAVEHYREAVELDSKSAPAHNNLAIALTRLGQLDEAGTHFRQALQLKPEFAEAHNNLGHVRMAQGKFDEAAGRYRKAIQLKPDYVEAHSHLGIALLKQGLAHEAVASFQKAVDLQPGNVEGWSNLGNALLMLGRVSESVAASGRALQFDPLRQPALSNTLLALNYDPNIDPHTLAEKHRQAGESIAARSTPATSHPNVADPDRRLRIGYVSPDIRFSAAAAFIEPLVKQHDRSAVEVILYGDVLAPDAVTERISKLADRWRVINGLTDQQVADFVRGDAVDILVDLAGYTSANRLGIFAQKPAPVQVSYLGYPTTTGLPTIDYRVTDAIVDPEGDETLYTEKLVRLPHGFCCFQPPSDAPAVSPLPARKSGQITFGSLHNLPKVNDQVVALWSQVLSAVPGSRLVLFRDTFRGGADEYFRDLFRRHGVESPRVEFRHAAVSDSSYLAQYHDIDISLDTFPWSGHTTACESLWMGVPVLTLLGDRAAGRMVASVLERLGLNDWVAKSPAEYVESAQRLSGNLDALDNLRGSLRERLAASSLCNGQVFARDLEAAYREMWRTWCGPRG